MHDDIKKMTNKAINENGSDNDFVHVENEANYDEKTDGNETEIHNSKSKQHIHTENVPQSQVFPAVNKSYPHHKFLENQSCESVYDRVASKQTNNESDTTKKMTDDHFNNHIPIRKGRRIK